MPLSEEELRLLEQMERALVEEDPKFASTLRGTSFRRSARRRAIAAGVAFVAGIGVLMAGAVYQVTPVGILGFVIMLVAATVGLTALRGRSRAADAQDATFEEGGEGFGLTVIEGGRTRGRRPHGRRNDSTPFIERMEERWRRRREGDGGF